MVEGPSVPSWPGGGCSRVCRFWMSRHMPVIIGAAPDVPPKKALKPGPFQYASFAFVFPLTGLPVVTT